MDAVPLNCAGRMSSLAFPKPTPRVLERQKQRRAQQVRLRAMILGVRKRDEDRCRACGRPCWALEMNPERRAHLHHLVFRSASKALRDAPTNLVTLCGRCHAQVHAHQLHIVGTDASKPLGFRWADEIGRREV